MHLFRHLDRAGQRLSVPVLTLGNFDGVHRGHQQILRRVVERARQSNGTAVVLTFQPHPTAVLAPQRPSQLITHLRTRVERIAESGIDAVFLQRFTQAFSRITAEDFVRRVLVDRIGVKAVVVGHRVTFGHQRGGDAALLRRLAQECGFELEVVGPVQVDGVEVSSSAVRHAIVAGELEQAESLLGHPFNVCGRVVHGQHRGKTLGFPTANLRVGGLVLPPDGVYAVRVRVGKNRYAGVANLGKRPTFGEHERSLETHVFDLGDDLYGRLIDVSFVKFLRGEVRFPSVQALVEQIGRDAADACRVLADAPST